MTTSRPRLTPAELVRQSPWVVRDEQRMAISMRLKCNLDDWLRTRHKHNLGVTGIQFELYRATDGVECSAAQIRRWLNDLGLVSQKVRIRREVLQRLTSVRDARLPS